jgi:outer membrane receptor protein involved in Fe transport
MKQTVHLEKKALVTAIAFAFASTYATDIFAQAQESQETKGKEDAPAVTVVTVTAQGRRENILKIPYNISSLNGDQLSERNIVDQAEMLRGVAGASVVDRGARNSGVLSGVTIRGMNVNGSALGDFQTSAVPTVSTYVNSTPLFANFLIKDVDRVEVLRGPQGTLYGSGSLGGTVRYITRRPELNAFSGKIEGIYSKTEGSSGSNYSADGIFNFPITNTIAARVAIGKVDNAGVIDYRNVYVLDAKGEPAAPKGKLDPAASYRNVKDADTVVQKYARISVLAKPSASFQALLTYQTQKDDVGGRRQPTRGNDGFGVPYDKYENGSVQLEPSSREVSLTALEMDLDLGFATLSSATSHYDQSGKSLSENTGFYAKNAWLANYYYNYPRPMAQADRRYGDRAFVQEIRLVSQKGSSFDYIVGAYLQNQTLDASQMSYLVGLKSWADLAMPHSGVTSDNDFLFQRTQEFKERAFFGELTWHLAPTLRLTGGMRAFKTDFNNDSVLGSGVIAPANAPIRTINAQKDSGNLFKGNLSWDLAPQQMLYATVSQGYRRAGANAVPLTGTFAESPAWQTFNPDTNTNSEIGIKGVEGNFRYNLSLFDIRWKNIQIDTTTPVWGFYVAQNGGKASSKGLELELSGRLTTDLRFGLNYAFVNAKLSEDVLRADRPSVVSAVAGTVLPGTAKHTVSANLDHVTPLSNDWYWTNRISAYHQSATQNSISQSPREKATWSGFSQFGISSTLAADKWSATFFVKNLTNSEGVTGGFLESAMGTAPAQNYYGNGSKVLISQPRTIGLSASYTF